MRTLNNGRGEIDGTVRLTRDEAAFVASGLTFIRAITETETVTLGDVTLDQEQVAVLSRQLRAIVDGIEEAGQ